MFELLNVVRAHSEHPLPYYLIVGDDAKYSTAILDGIRTAAAVHGVSGFINLSRLVKDIGHEEACCKLREGVRAIMQSIYSGTDLPFPTESPIVPQSASRSAH